jgi:hypothetical protein
MAYKVWPKKEKNFFGLIFQFWPSISGTFLIFPLSKALPELTIHIVLHMFKRIGFVGVNYFGPTIF